MFLVKEKIKALFGGKMSNNKKEKKAKKQIGEKTLKLQDLKDFTVGEIVEQSHRVDQENQENESVLDKYIRQHRGEIEEAKNKNLDEYIHQERGKLQETAELSNLSAPILSEEKLEKTTDEPISEKESPKEEPEDKTEESSVTEPILDPVVRTDEAVSSDEKPKKEDSPIILSANEMPLEEKAGVSAESVQNKEENQKVQTESLNSPSPILSGIETESKKKNKTPLIIGACALVLVAFAGIGFAQYNTSQHSKPVQTAKSSSNSTSDLDKFTKAYDAFFMDKTHNALKNSQFNQLTALEKMIEPHKNSSAWANAVSETQDLKTEIAAINTVNHLFTKAAITDGKLDTSAQIVANVKIPAVPKTNNDSLNQLLTKAIEQAKAQQTKAQATKASSQNALTPAKPADKAVSSNSTNPTENTASNSGTTSQPAANSGGLSSAGVTLAVASARVQPQAGINPNDSAFVWGDGILEKVLNICRERGYIQGNNYILVPTAIHTTNGTQGFPAGIVSGYYNLYAPDGRYLVSINDKTGYFVGNGAGHASDLDYNA